MIRALYQTFDSPFPNLFNRRLRRGRYAPYRETTAVKQTRGRGDECSRWGTRGSGTQAARGAIQSVIPHTALVRSTEAKYLPARHYAAAPARRHAFRVLPAIMLTVAAALGVSASIALHGLAARSSGSVGKLKAALPAVTARLVIPAAFSDSGLGWQQRPTPSATHAGSEAAPKIPYTPFPAPVEQTGFLFTITMGVSASSGGEQASTLSPPGSPPGPTTEPGTVPEVPEVPQGPQTELNRSPAQTSDSEADDESHEDDTEDEEAEPSEHEDEREPDDGAGSHPPEIGQ